jgi:hypothetical protein
VRAVAVRLLAKSFADQRRDSVAARGDLSPQRGFLAESRPIEDGRNCIGRFERLLINLQFFQCFRDHAAGYRMFRAGDQRPTTNDQ